MGSPLGESVFTTCDGSEHTLTLIIYRDAFEKKEQAEENFYIRREEKAK